jgi:predicted RNase H-like HicB family nuclease
MIRAHAARGFTVEYPDLPGCLATAPTFREAQALAGPLLARHLQGLESGGLPLPEPRTMKELQESGLAEAAVPVLVPAARAAAPNGDDGG